MKKDSGDVKRKRKEGIKIRSGKGKKKKRAALASQDSLSIAWEGKKKEMRGGRGKKIVRPVFTWWRSAGKGGKKGREKGTGLLSFSLAKGRRNDKKRKRSQGEKKQEGKPAFRVSNSLSLSAAAVKEEG